MGLRIDKKTNAVNERSNGTIRVAPKAVPEKSGKNDYEVKDDNIKARIPDGFDEKQDVLGVKSTNHQPEEKIIKADVHKSPEKSLAKPASANGSESNDSGTEVLPKSRDSLSPGSAKVSLSLFKYHISFVSSQICLWTLSYIVVSYLIWRLSTLNQLVFNCLHCDWHASHFVMA